MSESDEEGVDVDEVPDQPSGAAPRGPSGDGAVGKVARVRCLDQVKARGFTFARGKVVDAVPLAHAEYLASGGKVEILEVF